MLFPFSDLLSVGGYRFSRPFYERTGYKAIEKDGGLVVLLNALGVRKEDITIEPKSVTFTDRQIISVHGKTHDDVFNCDYEVDASFIVYRPVKTIEWDSKDGYVQMWLEFEEPVKPSVKIISK